MEPIAQTVAGAYPRPERLSPAVRLQLAWSMSWPCMLLDLAYRLVETQSNLPKQQIQIVGLIFGLLAFFFFSTWVVRRAIQLDYKGFQVVVARAGGDGSSHTLTYRESLAVTWLICWRSECCWLSRPLLWRPCCKGPISPKGLPVGCGPRPANCSFSMPG